MHVVIYEKGTNKIKYFIKDCIRRGKHFVGSNIKVNINLNHFDVIWTDDTVNPIVNNNEIVGWDKDVSDLTPSTDITEIKSLSRNEFKAAFKLRKLIDNMSYQELDDYIETNVVDLASAKVFIKTLAKVTLALCKLTEK
jgi:hypothetical protein